MNYIPGFSNYLQASVPRYAKGGPARFVEDVMYDDYGMGGYGGDPIMDTYQQAAVMPMTQEAVPAAAPYVEPYQSTPAAQPMTQEAAAPYDLSGVDLSSLYGLNLGGPGNTGLAGLPSLGAGYTPLFEEQLITAPISNKGNPTAYGVNNQFYMSPNNLVRIVDRSTNKVLFEGVGYDAAKKAVEIGQNLTDTMGRSASYQIETGTTPDNYSPVANEKYNPSTMSKIGNVAGTVLPLAMMAVPGLNVAAGKLLGSQLLGSLALGAGTGGLSAGLKGDNILKGAVIGGLSAAGGSFLPKVPAIGDLGKLAQPLGVGVGSTVGNLVTGQSLKNSLLSGAASGALAYATPGIQKGLGIGQGAAPSTGGGGGDANVSYGGANAPIIVSATPSFTPSVNLGGFKTPAQKYVGETAEPTLEEILVSARPSFTPSVNFGPSNVPAGGLNAVAEPTLEEILVKARPSFTPPVNLNLSTAPIGGLDTLTAPELEEILVKGRETLTPSVDLGTDTDLIKVTGRRTEPGPSITIDAPVSETPEEAEAKKKKLGLEEYLRLAGLASGLIGGAAGGSRQTGTYGGGTGRLNPIFSAKLPSAGGLGSIGMNRTQRPMGDVDWLTYGTRPELSFFDYAPRSNPAPVAQPAAPAPITTPVSGNPAGPAMYVPDDMRFAEGGAFAAKHGGSSKRTEFAVNGAGTGRSDDIPAVLSDGEYVIDAETVALLGDGSSKAGAKKLDELRVKVRKHKGQKLAKGRFSANAKRPEAYLSGGRI